MVRLPAAADGATWQLRFEHEQKPTATFKRRSAAWQESCFRKGTPWYGRRGNGASFSDDGHPIRGLACPATRCKPVRDKAQPSMTHQGLEKGATAGTLARTTAQPTVSTSWLAPSALWVRAVFA